MSEDIDLRPFGWAPGKYIGGCRTCGKRDFDDLRDKYAWNCRACAVAAYRSAELTKPAAPIPPPSETARLREENERLRGEIVRLKEVRLLDSDQMDVTDKLTDLQNERDWALEARDEAEAVTDRLREALEEAAAVLTSMTFNAACTVFASDRAATAAYRAHAVLAEGRSDAG